MNELKEFMIEIQHFFQQSSQTIEWLGYFFIINTLFITFIQIVPILIIFFTRKPKVDFDTEQLCITSELAPPYNNYYACL